MSVYFSICIPQYNRTDFLISACRTFAAQSFRDFEICISDDCSNDGKQTQLDEFLAGSGLRYILRQNEVTQRYDGNLRSAIALSTAKYLLLMGNDDGLAGPDVLQKLHDELELAGGIAVAISNYREMGTGRIFNRMLRTEVLGSGPELAAATFRDYSFVSGIVLDGPKSRALASEVVDGSEMYQMYLGTRLISQGGRFLAIAEIVVDKDLQIEGQSVDSYRVWPRLVPCPIVKRRLPMGRLLEVVAAGMRPHTPLATLDRLLYRVGRDLYSFTYAFWAIEYRRVQSWKYALGVLLALSPADIAAGQNLSLFSRAKLWVVYLCTVSIGLLSPIIMFDAVRPWLYRIAKSSK